MRARVGERLAWLQSRRAAAFECRIRYIMLSQAPCRRGRARCPAAGAQQPAPVHLGAHMGQHRPPRRRCGRPFQHLRSDWRASCAALAQEAADHPGVDALQRGDRLPPAVPRRSNSRSRRPAGRASITPWSWSNSRTCIPAAVTVSPATTSVPTSTDERRLAAAGPKGVVEPVVSSSSVVRVPQASSGRPTMRLSCRTSSRPRMWSAWAWVNRTASTPGTRQASNCCPQVGPGIDQQPGPLAALHHDAAPGAAVARFGRVAGAPLAAAVRAAEQRHAGRAAGAEDGDAQRLRPPCGTGGGNSPS